MSRKDETFDDLLRTWIVSGRLHVFADKSGVPSYTIKRIRARGTIRYSTAQRIARGLGLKGKEGTDRVIAAVARQAPADGSVRA